MVYRVADFNFKWCNLNWVLLVVMVTPYFLTAIFPSYVVPVFSSVQVLRIKFLKNLRNEVHLWSINCTALIYVIRIPQITFQFRNIVVGCQIGHWKG